MSTESEFFSPFKNGYRFNRKLFKYYGWLLYLAAAVGMFIYGYEDGKLTLTGQKYVYCPVDAHGRCDNQFYQTCTDDPICNIEKLYPGQRYGNPPPSGLLIYENMMWFSIVLVFVLNHFLYNRGIKFEV